MKLSKCLVVGCGSLLATQLSGVDAASSGLRKMQTVEVDTNPNHKLGLKCINQQIKADKGDQICLNEGEAICIDYDQLSNKADGGEIDTWAEIANDASLEEVDNKANKGKNQSKSGYKNNTARGRWKFGILDGKLVLLGPHNELVWEFCDYVTKTCIGENGNGRSPYLKIKQGEEIIAKLTCNNYPYQDDSKNIQKDTILKMVDNSRIDWAHDPLTIVKGRKGDLEPFWKIKYDPKNPQYLHWDSAEKLPGFMTYDKKNCSWEDQCPSNAPSSMPSAEPSSMPSSKPSSSPTSKPSSVPSGEPSSEPSSVPSEGPSDSPSSVPSLDPSSAPSSMPSLEPSSAPSSVPSLEPSSVPSSVPSLEPSSVPSSMPSETLLVVLTGPVVINEIMQNPSGTDTNREWFELYNPSPYDVDTNQWIIQDDDGDLHTIGGPLIIQAGGYLVLCSNGNSTENGGVDCDYEYSNFVLANSDDEVILNDPFGTEIDRVEYDNGDTFPDPTGASMALSNPALNNNDGMNWCTSGTPFGNGDFGTPGAPNDCATRSGTVIINEIMRNPAAVTDANGEWFELYNPTPYTIDINGWTIRDDGTDVHEIDNSGPLIIQAGGYLVLCSNGIFDTNGGVDCDYEYSNFVLANSDDEVILIDPFGTEIDRVEYDNGDTFPDPTGASMALSNPALNNNDGMNWCTSGTPFGNGDFGTPGAPKVCL